MSEWIISTSSGKVRGYEREERVEFLGIPYAEAPVGPRRLKRSVAKEAWDGIFDAKVYGASPVQLNQGKVIGDEDCLTVNIKRPLTGEKLPIFVWIYGGGYNPVFDSLENTKGSERQYLCWVLNLHCMS